MGCSKYIEWISAALDGELTAKERRELDSHLADCSQCAALYEQLSAQSRTLRDLDGDFPAGLHDRIMAALPQQDAPAKNKDNVIQWKRWGTIAACLVLVIAIGAFAAPFGMRMGSAAPSAAEMAPGMKGTDDAGVNEASEHPQEAPEQHIGVESVGSDAPLTFSKVQYLRVSYGFTPAAPAVTVFSDTAALADYLSGFKSGAFDENDVPVPMAELDALLDTYTEEYFARRSLLLVLVEEGSGSISHEIQSITGDAVTVRRIIPEVGTCDMAAWLLVVELDNLLDAGHTFELRMTQ